MCSLVSGSNRQFLHASQVFVLSPITLVYFQCLFIFEMPVCRHQIGRPSILLSTSCQCDKSKNARKKVFELLWTYIEFGVFLQMFVFVKIFVVDD